MERKSPPKNGGGAAFADFAIDGFIAIVVANNGDPRCCSQWRRRGSLFNSQNGGLQATAIRWERAGTAEAGYLRSRDSPAVAISSQRSARTLRLGQERSPKTVEVSGPAADGNSFAMGRDKFYSIEEGKDRLSRRSSVSIRPAMILRKGGKLVKPRICILLCVIELGGHAAFGVATKKRCRPDRRRGDL